MKERAFKNLYGGIDYGDALNTMQTHRRLAAKKKHNYHNGKKFGLQPVSVFYNDEDVVIMMMRSRRGMTKGNQNQ